MRLKLWLLCSALLLAGQAVAAGQETPVPIVPTAPWVGIFFESIDDLAGRLNLRPLRAVNISPGDLEVRIWEGFGLSPLRGFILRRTDAKWSALAPTYWPDRRAKFAEVPRSTDWAKTWEELERGGLAELRDDSEIPQCVEVLDGVGYVVEIASAGYYRTFLIDNPQSRRSEDGDRFLRLLPTLRRAFGEEPTESVPPLPTGQIETVSALSSEGLGFPPIETSDGWRSSAGPARVGRADILLAAADALAQGVTLTTARCRDLQPILRRIRIVGDVVVEVRIAPDGSVSAVRVISGPPLLRDPSMASALKWRFKPLAEGIQSRGALIAIRYKDEWVEFPWIK